MRYIREAIESRCPELYYNLGRVRRKVPFNMRKFKSIKPICIENMQGKLSLEDIREAFGEHILAYNQRFNK
jgi:hypothetical protein